VTAPPRPAGREAAGTAWALLAATGFGAVSVLTSIATAEGVSLANVLLWRYVLGAAVLVLWVVGTGKPRTPWRHAWQFVVIGGGGQALLVYLALSSLAYIPAATLAFLFYTYPAWVALVQWVRGAERPDARSAGALALALAGIVAMVGTPAAGAVDWRGVALALSAAIVYGVFIPVARWMQRDYGATVSSAYGKIGAATCFLVLSMVQRDLGWEFSARAWAAIGALTLFSTVLPGVFFVMALVRLGPLRTAIVSTVEPFLTAVLAFLALRQPLTAATLGGGALIVAAVVLLQLRRAAD
jgi:drug/metabolite transporter (DMT)-like permease